MQMIYENQTNLLDPNKSEIVSLMISYIKGQLSPVCELKMDSLIENCEECKKLYNEVSLFFDTSDTLLYEIKNEQKVTKTREYIYTLGEIYDNIKISKQTEDTDCEEQYKEVFNLIEDTDCFCCG